MINNNNNNRVKKHPHTYYIRARSERSETLIFKMKTNANEGKTFWKAMPMKINYITLLKSEQKIYVNKT